EAREKAVAFRRRVLVGVNHYPNLDEEPPPDFTPQQDGAEGLPPWRAAAAFERIRRRTARHARRTGRTPVVLLLERGDRKARLPRSACCFTLFGGARFNSRPSGAIERGAALITLCSSGPGYVPLAQEVWPRVNVPVIVAGNPKEQIE